MQYVFSFFDYFGKIFLMNKVNEFFLTKSISEGSTESILRIIDAMLSGAKKLRLNWSETEEVTPGGVALLMLLYDLACERGIKIDSVFASKKLKECPIIARLSDVRESQLCDATAMSFTVDGGQYFCLENKLPKDLLPLGGDPFDDADRSLLFRELTQNAIDHSSSERFYAYQAIYNNELCIGVLDLGVGIAPKLKNHFNFASDLDYIEAALEKGSTSRRLRQGGVGLYLVSQLVKRLLGRMVILSGEGQLRRYYANRRIDRKTTKFRTPGTWIFITVPASP